MGSLYISTRFRVFSKQVPIVILCQHAMRIVALYCFDRVELASDNAAMTIALETDFSKAGQAFRCPDKAVQYCFVLCPPDG